MARVVAWYAWEEVQPICRLVFSINPSSLLCFTYCMFQSTTALYLTDLFCVSPTPHDRMYKMHESKVKLSVVCLINVKRLRMSAFVFHSAPVSSEQCSYVYHNPQSFTLSNEKVPSVFQFVPLMVFHCRRKCSGVEEENSLFELKAATSWHLAHLLSALTC